MSDLQTIFGTGFDSDSVEPQSDFEVLSPGKYPVMIENAEVKKTKKENGHYLEVTMSILDGPGKNRKLWDRINIDNPSTQSVEIGLRTLAALCQACGIGKLTDEAQLINTAVIAHVKVRSSGNYGEQNEIRTYSAVADQQGAGQAMQQPAATSSKSQSQTASKQDKMPWERTPNDDIPF